MSEVYFNAPNMKVFDIVLNGDLTVVSDLDIFEKVGRGVAHDEYVEFSVEDNRIIYQAATTNLSTDQNKQNDRPASRLCRCVVNAAAG